MTGPTVDFRLPRLEESAARGIRDQATARGITRDEVVRGLWMIRRSIVERIETGSASGFDRVELLALLDSVGLPLTVRLG